MSTDTTAKLIAVLQTRGEILAAAESCTGGLIGAAVTDVSGSSAVFWGSVVSYANDAKIGVLGVDASILASEGAVSGAVAKAMAWGVRSLSGSDWSVSVTGIAGPGGGSAEKPVGTVWIGWCSPQGSVNAERFCFDGDRQKVRSSAVEAALGRLLELVLAEGTATVLDR